VLKIGARHPIAYLNLVKGLFAGNKHEVIELHAFGDKSIVKLTVVMRLLVNYKYCEVVRIKTGTMPAPVLKVSFKKCADFQTSFDAHQEIVKQRREEREREKAAAAEANKAEATNADALADSAEAKTEVTQEVVAEV